MKTERKPLPLAAYELKDYAKAEAEHTLSTYESMLPPLDLIQRRVVINMIAFGFSQGALYGLRSISGSIRRRPDAGPATTVAHPPPATPEAEAGHSSSEGIRDAGLEVGRS